MPPTVLGRGSMDTDKLIDDSSSELRKTGRLMTVLSALIVCLSYAGIKLTKVAVAGVEIEASYPYVITGALGIVLLHTFIRYFGLGYFLFAIRMATQTGADKELLAKVFRKPAWAVTFIFSRVLLLVIGLFEVGLLAVALYTAWPDMVKLAKLILA
jgi:hypothetical protein